MSFIISLSKVGMRSPSALITIGPKSFDLRPLFLSVLNSDDGKLIGASKISSPSLAAAKA